MKEFKQTTMPISTVLAYIPPKIKKYRPLLDPKTLTTGQRKALWAGIKRDSPALAEMLTNDPIIDALKTTFNASVMFYADEAIDYMKD